MFGRKTKKTRKAIVHTAECTAIHEAMLMSLYLGYGAPSAPLFIPTGSLVCTCGDEGGGSDTTTDRPEQSSNLPPHRALVGV